MARLREILFAAALGAWALGCASEVGDESSAAVETTSAAAGGDPVVEPPLLKAVAPFSNVLRLFWETPAPCDAVEGERKTATSPFEVVFDVPGTDIVFVDGEAYLDQDYTYRLRCERDGVYSVYSKEVTGNPSEE